MERWGDPVAIGKCLRRLLLQWGWCSFFLVGAVFGQEIGLRPFPAQMRTPPPVSGTDEAGFRGELVPAFQEYQEYLAAVLAPGNGSPSHLRLPYAVEALGPALHVSPEAEPVKWAAESPVAAVDKTVAALSRGRKALERGTVVLAALDRNFLPPSALPWLLQAHRFSLGTIQEPRILERLFRHLLANRYPVETIWMTLRYMRSLDLIWPPKGRMDLDPQFLRWEIRGLEAALEGTSAKVAERLPVPGEWFPQAPDRLYRFALLMREQRRLPAAREAARRFCMTSIWGEKAFGMAEREDLLASVTDAGLNDGGSPTASSDAPEGIRKLVLEVSQPLPDYGAKPLPPVVKVLEWSGREYVSHDREMRCPGDIVSFLVQKARTASPSVVLPVPSKRPYQVRVTLETSDGATIVFWSELGPNRWMFPLFVAAGGALRYLDDPEAIWAMLHLFQRNSFLEALHQGFRHTPCGVDLSAEFIASAGILEKFPEIPWDTRALRDGEKAERGRPMIFAHPGLPHPVVIQGISLEKKGGYSSPRSSLYFYRRVIGTGSSPLPPLEDIQEMRTNLEMQLSRLIGTGPESLHLSPECEYEIGETMVPELRHLTGFDIEAGIPSGNAAAILVKLLRALGLRIPVEGPFPQVWRFRAKFETGREMQRISLEGYWLDFARTMVIAEVSLPLGETLVSEINHSLGRVFSLPPEYLMRNGELRMIDGFMYSNHSLTVKEPVDVLWTSATERLRKEGWVTRFYGTGKDRALELRPPKGTILFLVKRLGEPLRLERATRMAVSRAE